jgi:hypothetical protein
MDQARSVYWPGARRPPTTRLTGISSKFRRNFGIGRPDRALPASSRSKRREPDERRAALKSIE